jgi:2-polyprenyl-3-methyl-5-hydroxy-6-metoxy-1,4-benzoquinol methylase
MAKPPVQEKYHDPNPVVRFLLRRFFDRIRSAVGEIAPETVLDAGCGEGELARRSVLPGGTRVISLDMRTEPLAFFRAHSEQRDFVCASLAALPFADRSLDAVLCLEVLEHLAEPAAALDELARVARRALILSVPHEPYFRIGNVLRGKHLGRWGNHPEHVQHWNFRTFGDFLRPRFGQVEIRDAFPWIVACCRLGEGTLRPGPPERG